MIDESALETALVQIVKTFVGADLATITNSGGTTPAVIKARQDGPKPDLPYITVDVRNFIMPSGWLANHYVDDSNNLKYEILYEMFVDIRCYGNNSSNILRKFHSYLSIPEVVPYIENLMSGAKVHQQGEIIDIPSVLSTDFEESASLTSSFYIIDEITDPVNTTDLLHNVNAEGTVITGVDGDIIVNISTE